MAECSFKGGRVRERDGRGIEEFAGKRGEIKRHHFQEFCPPGMSIPQINDRAVCRKFIKNDVK